MSELRRDPITGRTVIIAPDRVAGLRPWTPAPVVAIDGDMCPFCEGQEHVAGQEILAWRPPGHPHNGRGWRVRVVANRLPALRVESHYAEPANVLFQTLGGLGAHEVIIESPDHRASWATMSVEDLYLVLWAWRERMRDLRRDIRLKAFLVVKNVGAAAGATLDHAHSQLLALPFVPLHLDDELVGARVRHHRTRQCAFCAVVEEELAEGVRVVSHDADTIAIAPFASRVPFETWVLSRHHSATFEDESDDSLRAVAERLRDLVQRLHHTLKSPAYSVLLHTAPVGEAASFHWHLEMVPRLTAVNGLAWDGGIHVNPVSPEEATQALRDSLGS
jgi:UDPglucose--hexose-1-phosphate uridylyltransferase